jgi:hypothetical protein
LWASAKEVGVLWKVGPEFNAYSDAIRTAIRF